MTSEDMMEKTGWAAYVGSDVYAGSVNEDGERPDELAFYVICENARGDRYRSHVAYTTEEFPWQYDDKGERFHPAEKKAEAFLQKVVEYLLKGADPSKSDKWLRTFPMYGSEAYVSYGAAMERRLEAEWDRQTA